MRPHALRGKLTAHLGIEFAFPGEKKKNPFLLCKLLWVVFWPDLHVKLPLPRAKDPFSQLCFIQLWGLELGTGENSPLLNAEESS